MDPWSANELECSLFHLNVWFGFDGDGVVLLNVIALVNSDYILSAIRTTVSSLRLTLIKDQVEFTLFLLHPIALPLFSVFIFITII